MFNRHAITGKQANVICDAMDHIRPDQSINIDE